MSSLPTLAPDDEIARLKSRVGKLAEEKSYLQLVVRLIEQLNPLPGLDDMVRGLLYSIVETIGGTNIKLYYWIEDELHYVDFLGEEKILAEIDDPQVRQVQASREFAELSSDPADALLLGGYIPGAWTWTFPLLVGKELVGIIKLENIHIIGALLRDYLPIFFSHAALILSNEVRAHTRHKIEAELRISEKKLSDILENVSAYIYLKDIEGRYLYVNRPVRALFGATMEEIIGFDDSKFFDAETTEKLGRNDNLVIRHGETIRIEEENVDRKSGEVRTFWSIKLPLQREDGSIYALCGISTDISARKEYEAGLIDYQNRLEAEVKQRTAELSQAKDMAESANRMKSVFLANMSHELRTPLNAILGFAQIMARDERIPEDERSNLATISRSGEHLLSLINDVLDISRIEAGRLGLQQESCDLHDLLHSVGEFVEVRARDKGLTLRLDIAPSLPRFISTDPRKLRQILLNLLTNAVKFTLQGEVALIADAAVSADQARLRFAIKDTGVGIAAKDIDAIFAPFFQTEQGVSQGEGTGLGLTISREFARLLGGELSVESVLRQGTTFTLQIPARLASPLMAEAPHRGRVIGLAAGEPSPRILVVEDNGDSRLLLKTILEQTGFAVRSAENGLQAVEMFKSWQPEFIWMDMRMPVMDGYQATRQIRALPGGRDVKIVALTASAFKEDQATIIASGCDDMLAKPIDENKLFEMMARLLQHKYRYADEIAPAILPAHDPDLSPLPAEVRDPLRIAAEQLDVEAVRALIARIREDHPDLARDLEQLTNAYRFDRISAL